VAPKQQEELSAAQTSHGYAAAIIAKQPEAKSMRKSEFVPAMYRRLAANAALFAANTPRKVRLDWRVVFGVLAIASWPWLG
jgi:hypothetical protein